MYTIRIATEADITVIQDLNRKLFVEESARDDVLDTAWPDSAKGVTYFQDALKNPEKRALIAQDGNGTVIGYVIGSTINRYDYRKDAIGELENMYVLPSHRGNGVGTELVSSLKTWLKGKGIRRIYVSAYYANAGAVSFYTRMGFREIDVGMEVII